MTDNRTNHSILSRRFEEALKLLRIIATHPSWLRRAEHREMLRTMARRIFLPEKMSTIVDNERQARELALGEWPKLSDREIARICAVGHPFVGDVRASQQQVESDTSSTRIGADGKTRKVATVATSKGGAR